MRRYLVVTVGGLCCAEAVIWTWFRLRRPKPLPFRPDWLDEEVAKLRTSTCELPHVCTPQSPECGTCRRACSQFAQKRRQAILVRGESEALSWDSLAEWQRESWRREVAA